MTVQRVSEVRRKGNWLIGETWCTQMPFCITVCLTKGLPPTFRLSSTTRTDSACRKHAGGQIVPCLNTHQMADC